MFITKNQAMFHLGWNKNFVKHQNILKYYENDCILIYGTNAGQISYSNIPCNFALTPSLWPLQTKATRDP